MFFTRCFQIIGVEKRAKRKRRLIVDEVKAISGEDMKCQLNDFADIISTLDLAPPTKKLMGFKETGGVDKLFSAPGLQFASKQLIKVTVYYLFLSFCLSLKEICMFF